MSGKKYPECDKMSAVKSQSDVLTRFVDWLASKEYSICKFEESTQDFTCEDCGKTFTLAESKVDKCNVQCPDCGDDLGEWDEDLCVKGGWAPLHQNFENLFADFFKIDLKKVEEERRAILDELRSKNG